MAWTSEGSGRTSSSAWRTIRKQTLERDHHLCRLRLPNCTTEATEAHHDNPFYLGGADTLANLLATCSSCHKVKTAEQSAAARAANRRALQHPSARRKHPGLL